MNEKPGFKNLKIWQIAYELMLKVHKICKTLPPDERFRIRDQAERSSGSTVDAISEGYSSYYFKDKMKSFFLARREAGETQNHLIKMAGKGYLSTEKADRLIENYEGLIMGINGFIRYIKHKQTDPTS